MVIDLLYNILIIDLGKSMQKNIVNIYCDESCHLENEQCKIMVVACIRCPKELVPGINEDLIDLKIKHNIWKYAETKWTKVSFSKINYYKELLDYFFKNENINFRAIVINKTNLNHPAKKQNHNSWYFKMIYLLVDKIMENNKSYNIYVDKKEDSYQARKELNITKECLRRHCENLNMQNITSYQSQLMQLNDFIQGIVCYYNRGLHKEKDRNNAKIALIDYIKNKGINLDRTNYDSKFNLLFWEGM